MKGLRLKKLKRVDLDVPDGDIVAFQMVSFDLDFFGTVVKFDLDTKILKDGKQIVIDGNGYIDSGFELPSSS